MMNWKHRRSNDEHAVASSKKVARGKKLLALLALLIILIPFNAFAQDAAPPASAPAENAERETPSFLGKEGSQGVYVRDSTIAVEKFALASRMERLKEWDKAADALQELVEKYTDRVVPSKKYENDVIYQYTSVTRAVHEQLAKWPAEGLDAYRARFEGVAADLLATDPSDLSTLNQVYTRYFPTNTGKAAAISLIDRHLESGEFPAAAWLGDRLLKLHPALDADRPMMLYRTALAYHLAGDAGASKPLLEELTQNHADAKGVVRGQEIALAESLATELNVAPPVARAPGNDSWPMVGGSPSRSRVYSAVGRMGAKIFDVPYLAPVKQSQINSVNRVEWANSDNLARENGQMLGVMPAVDRGELFFQDNANIHAVNLDSGLPLPGWATTHASRNGVYTSPRAQALPRNLQSSVVVTENEVLAITGQLDREAMARGMLQGIDRESRLVCLDRASGAEKWVATTRGLPEQAAALRGLEIGASPLVAGDQVFVIMRGGKPNAFEDCYVVCFGLKDGKYRWNCYLASGSTGGDQADGFFMGLGNDAIPHLAYASGRVYALTNLGALGAIDAYNGATVWLNLYPRPAAEVVDFRRRMENAEALTPPKPWEQNAVIVDDGHVFVLPADGDQLLVYDAGSGVEIKRIPVADLGGARTLLGTTDDKVIVTSNNEVFCVRWSTYDPNASPFDNVFWQSKLVRSNDKDSIRGRGFVTASAVYVPTIWAINRISLDTGRLEETYPKDRDWTAGEGPGNIVVTEDHVVVAGSDGVNVFTDLEIARAKLDAAIVAAPNDPNPRMEYAEVMFVAGQLEDAATRLDEAIALLGGPSAMRPGAERDRVFNVALTFARKLTPSLPGDEDAATPPTETQLKLAPKLFDRAAAAATTPAQQVNYRVTRAQFAAATSNVADELRLYQEILLEPEWRAIQLTSRDDGNVALSANVSERAIGRILKTPGGPEAFAVFQQAASDELKAGAQGNDPNALLAIALRYPNTDTAPAAMLAAAELFEAQGKYRSATQVLNQADRRHRDRADRTKLIEAQVRNYLHLPNGLAVAIKHLSTGSKLSSESKFAQSVTLPDGSTIDAGTTFTAALDIVRQKSAMIAARNLPSLGIPVPSSKERRDAFVPESERMVLNDIDQLLVPAREFSRHDRIVTFTTGRGVSVFTPGATAPLSTTAALGEPATGCAWVGDADRNLLVWGNSSIALLTPDGNDAAWRVQLSTLTELQVVSATEGVVVDGKVGEIDTGTEVRIRENQPIRFGRGRRRGLQGMLDAANQQNLPAVNPNAAADVETLVHVCPLGDRVVLSTSTGRVVAIEYATGNVAWQTRLSVTAVHQMIAADDFAVVRVFDELGVQLIVLDTFAGQVTHRRVFSQESVPVNMTLAPDGTLVYTLNNRLCAKNLYDPRRELDFQYPSGPEGGPTYFGANMPDQLVVADDRIIAVSDNGVLVRVHSLETGKEILKAFTTGSSNWNVRVRVVGPNLYVVTQTGVTGYNLDHPERVWHSSASTKQMPNFRDSFVGDNFLLLLDQVTPRGADRVGDFRGVIQPPNAGKDNIGAPRFNLWAFGRYPGKANETAESGRNDYVVQVTHPVGISQWQAVEGGMYYRSADRKLHFLRGSDAKVH